MTNVPKAVEEALKDWRPDKTPIKSPWALAQLENAIIALRMPLGFTEGGYAFYSTADSSVIEAGLVAANKCIAELTAENANLIERGDKLNRDTQFYEAWVDKKLERMTGLEKENARLQSVAQLRFDRAEQLHEKNVELQAENERLAAALRAILDSQTFNPASLESDLYHVIPDSVLDAAGKVLEKEQPDTCNNCDQPAYQYWIDGTRYCREHQINRDSLEMEQLK